MKTKDSCTSSNGAMRCAIYARQASADQAVKSTAADQIDRCKKVAQENGWTVVESLIRADVGKSGTSIKNRTGLLELLALAATKPRPFECLMCKSSDRLARSWSRFVRVKNAFACAGVSLYFVQKGKSPSMDVKLEGKLAHDYFLGLARNYVECPGKKTINQPQEKTKPEGNK